MGHSHSKTPSRDEKSVAPEPACDHGHDAQTLFGNAHIQEQLNAAQPDPALGGARVGAPGSKADALAQHDRNRTIIDRFMRSAMAVEPDPSQGFNSRPNLLKNSAEWVDAGNATLHVLTPTHDAHLRPGTPVNQLAYFDTRVDYESEGSTYNDTLDAAGQATDDAGLVMKFSGVRGTMRNDGQSLWIMDPASSNEGALAEFFIHEVQHDADQHRTGEAWEVGLPAADPAATTRAPQWAYNNYQTEFRAYWMMNPEGTSADWFGSSTDLTVANFAIAAQHKGPDGILGNADDVTQTVNTSFTNRRQQDIFNHMHAARADNIYLNATNDWVSSYAYLSHYYALDPAFETMVDGYTIPASGNLVNSIRIQALSEAIAAGGLVAVVTAAEELDDLDRLYLQDRAQSQPLWDQAANLGAISLAVLEYMVDEPVMGPHQPALITVVTGDTLSAISERYLDDVSRWREIYRLNIDIIGSNPSLIRAGQQLRLPVM